MLWKFRVVLDFYDVHHRLSHRHAIAPLPTLSFFPSFYFWGHIARNFLLQVLSHALILEKDERKLIRIWKPGLYSLKWLQSLMFWKEGSHRCLFWWVIVLLLLERFGRALKHSIIFAESGVLEKLMTHGY